MKGTISWFAYGATLAALVLTTACKKEVERIVVQQVDKTYSWSEASRLFGTNNIIAQMNKDDNSLLLQSPYFLNIVSPQPASASYKRFGYVGTAATYFPSDVYLRLPMSRDFIAQPDQDSLVELLRPTEPVTNSYKAYIHLRLLDPLATSIIRTEGVSHQPFGAINRDNYLLFGYRTSGSDTNIHFALTHVSLQPAGNLQARTQNVLLPVGLGVSRNYVRWIQAIDDYFLVNCGDAGLYKIRENGTAKRVYSSSLTDTCYKWQGTVYLVEEYNKVLFSTDDGETWQRATGTPSLFDFTTYHVVSDSLIGVTHSLISQLFTLRWHGNQYSTRILRSDGIGLGEVRGLEQLGDTVYIGTTSGLFKRPLNKFFESKP